MSCKFLSVCEQAWCYPSVSVRQAKGQCFVLPFCIECCNTIFRLHRMHDMQTIAVLLPMFLSVSLSVTQLHLAEQMQVLFVVKIRLGPKNIMLDGRF